MKTQPVLQVIEHLGLRGDLSDTQFHSRCPFHEEDTASFDIRLDTGGWHCFGCGKSGNLIEFVAKAGSLSHFDALHLIHQLRKKAPRSPDEDDTIRRRTAVEYDLEQQWGRFHLVNWSKLALTHPVAQYLIEERGFTRKVLDAFDVRLSEWAQYPMVIPWRRDQELIGYV